MQMVITAVGPDRPGLVGEFTGLLHQAGANIADSRMVNLRGQFALLLLVEGEERVVGEIRRSITEAGRRIGLAVSIAGEGAATPAVTGVPYKLKTYSMDQPGIVHRVTSLLHQQGVNIEELATRQESAPFAGTPLFTMEARITVPVTAPIKQLRKALEDLCDTINCDMDLEPVG